MVTESNPTMKCGHAANGTVDGKPACAICIGRFPGATEVDPDAPDLTGRTAVCSYRHGATMTPVPSSTKLAFFEHRPDEDHDRFYDGCHGWD